MVRWLVARKAAAMPEAEAMVVGMEAVGRATAARQANNALRRPEGR